MATNSSTLPAASPSPNAVVRSPSSTPPLPLVASLLRAAQRARLRGSTRITFALARRMRMLQAVPVVVNNHETMFVDLRNSIAHVLLEGSPWDGAPWEVKEQLLMRWVVRPGDVVLDIGANIGLHTALLADLVGPAGHVHAFEPQHDLLYALQRTAEYAGNATIYPFGLGERREQRPLYIPEDDYSFASFADWTAGCVGKVHSATCEVRTLDELVGAGMIGRPRFIKCDVEGAETLVFRGARETLNHEDGPIVLYEASGKSARGFGLAISAATAVLRELENAGFEIFHLRKHAQLIPLPTFRADCDHYNLVAVPRSRIGEIRALITPASPG
jgi:FkbM family methyltransferase